MGEFPISSLRRAVVNDLPAYVQIAADLRRVIQQEQLGDGVKLPSESELLAHFGVARMTVREALRVLKTEGTVYSEQGRGVFVRNHRLRSEPGLQMGSTMTSNESEWREQVFAEAASRKIRFERIEDRWAAAALGVSRYTEDAGDEHIDDGELLGARVRTNHQGLYDDSTIFLPSTVQDPVGETMKVLECAHRWVVSVLGDNDGEQSLLRVTRVAMNGDRSVALVAKGRRSASWAVSTEENTVSSR